MGTVLSSPRENTGYWNQLRPSKSTFSLKDRNGGGASGSSGGLFRNGLSSSVSIRKLSQSSLGRRKDKQQQQQQQQQHHHQQQQPSISTISSASCWGGELAHAASPDSKFSSGRRSSGNGHFCHAPPARHLRQPALTKSTSCYAIKSVAAGSKNSNQRDGKENEDADSRKVVLQASTSDLLKCMGNFMHKYCGPVATEPGAVIGWIRSIDRSLILQGWADMAFVNPPNLVFLFMLIKAVATENFHSERQLQSTLFTCMYIAYSYMGNEISYPLKPFLIDDDRDAFWDRCLSIISSMSSDMLKINSDTTFFIDLFAELKSYS